MKNETVKRSLENSKNDIEEKRKVFKRKTCIKDTKMFTIIAMNFVQEQLIKSTDIKTECRRNYHFEMTMCEKSYP